MVTLIAILMFTGAMVAAFATIYATVAPALPKIQAALAGAGVSSQLPPLPPRRAPALRAMTIRPVAGDPRHWRAAA